MSEVRTGFHSFDDSHAPPGTNGNGDISQADLKQDVLEVIESEIIPRLCLAHRIDSSPTPACGESHKALNEAQLFELARLAVCQDLQQSIGYVELLCREGLTLEVALLDLIPAAARLLGEHWTSDLRTFDDFTAGMGTLQRMVNFLGSGRIPAVYSQAHSRTSPGCKGGASAKSGRPSTRALRKRT